MKEFVTTAMNAIADFDIDSLDTSAADIQSIENHPQRGSGSPSGHYCQFTANVTANGENLGDVIWTVEGNTGEGTACPTTAF